MSDDHREPTGASHPPAIPHPGTPAQTARLDVNASALTTSYCNFFRVTGTFEELIVDFGLHTGAILPSGPEPVKLSNRVVLSYPTAKRLLAALQVALGRHEQVFGPVETDPQKRAQKAR
jgi:hypothetical protein